MFLYLIQRAVLFMLLWWILTGGRGDGLGLGVVAVALATWVSLRLMPPGRRALRWRALPALAVYFLGQSLLGGWQVAKMALRPKSGLRPGWQSLKLDLPEGAARVLLLNLIGLMPGTLGARLAGQEIKLHLLDVGQPIEGEVRKLEWHIARLFGER